MNFEDLGTWENIIGLFITIFGVFFGAKYLIIKNKNVGRDDNSINIGNKNKIKDSFNREK